MFEICLLQVFMKGSKPLLQNPYRNFKLLRHGSISKIETGIKNNSKFQIPTREKYQSADYTNSKTTVSKKTLNT